MRVLSGFDIRTNVREFSRALNRTEQQQLPFATFLAINDTAAAGQRHNVRAMSRHLDRPKPYTKRGLYVRKARYRRGMRRQGLANAVTDASLMWREFAGKGTAAGTYLRPQVFGGVRNPKRHELALRRRGLIGRNSYVVPAPGQRLNMYGNMTRNTYMQMLSALGAAGDGQNRTARSRSRNPRQRNFFVPKQGGALKQGVYERKRDGSIKPVLIEVRQPRYRQRYDFFSISRNFTARQFPISMRLAMQRAMRTAR